MRKAILFLASLLTATTALAQPLVIRAARVLDGRGHQFANAAVVVENGRIVRIDEHPQRADIDLGDRTLLPGGIDTHVHIGWHFDAKTGRSHDGEPDRGESPEQSALYATENAYATLIGGITTVQSLGARVDTVVREASAVISLLLSPLPLQHRVFQFAK